MALLWELRLLIFYFIWESMTGRNGFCVQENKQINTFLIFFSSSQSVDRMTTFVSYILGQRSFYPLYPPDASMNVDHDLLDQFGMLQNTPHVLLLPSNFNGFIKV